jgi:Na+:H+ antiporter, NhaA family
MEVQVMKQLSKKPSFVQTDAFPGVVLLMMAALAFAWANSPLSGAYDAMRAFRIAIPFLALDKPLELWVNDLLMAMFFLLVGLELKREVMRGELANPRRAALAIFAALGGMIAPALVFLVFNVGTPAARGWGIPMATDIAFAVGVLSLLGTRVPLVLKVFLVALAVVDDMGAVIVIALFYTSSLNLTMLLLAGLVFAALWGLNIGKVKVLPLYLLLGAALWYFVLKSGLHATIAGVLLATTIPMDRHLESPARHNLLEHLEHSIKGFVTFFVMPVFALFNAGVPVAAALAGGISAVSSGVFLGLLLGKPLGILALSWLAVRSRLAQLPAGVSWSMVFGVGLLGGIGFTMALFIANLAYVGNSALEQAKLGVLGASLVAAVVGLVWLSRATSAQQPALRQAKTNDQNSAA